MEGMEAATSHAHVCALRMLHEDGGAHRVHACAQNALQDGVGMPRELRDAVSTMHACHMLPGRPLFPRIRLHGTHAGAARITGQGTRPSRTGSSARQTVSSGGPARAHWRM